jgi:hypothetical protein
LFIRKIGCRPDGVGLLREPTGRRVSASCHADNSAARNQRNNARFLRVAASRSDGATVWFARGKQRFDSVAVSIFICMLFPDD